jgi:hypothetical protein
MMKKVCKLILSKKFARSGKYCLSAIIFSALAFSCNEEELKNAPENFTGEEQEIVFSMNVPSVSDATPQLRSIGPAQENTIKTIDLLAFRKDDSGSTFDYHYTGALAADNTPGTSSQKCRVKVRLAKYEQEFVIITNAGTLVNTVVKSQNWQNTSKETFLANLEYTLSGTGAKWNAISASNYEALPMWGETSAIITQNTTQLSVSLLRMLARIDVQLDETKLNELKNIFKIKSVRLYNTGTKGRIVPNSANLKISDNIISVTAPSLPAASEKYLGPLVYQDFSAPGILDIAMKGAIYTFETEAPESSDNYGALEATSLVVGGIYGTDISESFYRVDFQKDGKFQDILRNHRYLVNIVSVTGSGYQTPDEAFRNRTINLDANILVWDESNMYDVTFDSQWYLSVSRDSIFISREVQDNQELFVKTDYNPVQSATTGWHIDSITDIATKAPCTWLTASPMKGAPNELKNVMLTTTLNNTGALRSARILFAAGRLRYPVTIHQSLLEKASITINFEGGFGTNPAEIIFPITLGEKNPPIKFTVDWTPKTADFVVYKTTVAGIPYSTFDVSPDISGITSGGNNNMPLVASVAPHATVEQTDIKNEPNYQRATKMVFSVSNGINTVEKSVILKHVYYGN